MSDTLDNKSIEEKQTEFNNATITVTEIHSNDLTEWCYLSQITVTLNRTLLTIVLT